MSQTDNESRQDGARYRVVWLPQKPAPNACRHLVELDGRRRVVRFLKQSPENLRLAGNREEAVWDRAMSRRVRRWIRHMRSLGFYRSR